MCAAPPPKSRCGAKAMPKPAPISRSKAWTSTPTNTPCSTCCARKLSPLPSPPRSSSSRSEEHTSELQSLMRNSYDVFCLKKKQNSTTTIQNHYPNQLLTHSHTHIQ